MEKGVAFAYIGMTYQQTDQLDSAGVFIDSALTIMRQDTSMKSKANIGSLLNEKANINKARGAYYAAIDDYIQSNAISTRYATKEKWINTAITNLNIAQVFLELEQYDKAIEYDEKARNLIQQGRKATKDPAYLHVLDKTFIKISLHIIENLIALGQKEEARQQLDQTYKDVLNINDQNVYADYYALRGDYSRMFTNGKEANDAYKKSLTYSVIGSSRKFKTLFELGNIAREQKNYPASIDHYKAALSASPNKKKNEASVLRSMAEVYALEGEYKHSSYLFNEFIQLNDSVNIANIKIKVNEIENQYQSKQKQDSILVLQKNAQLQRLTLRKKESQNMFILISGVLLLLAGILAYRNLRNKNRLLKKTEQLHQQQIVQLEKERQLVAAQSLMKGQEEERSRLAKDLHDGVGGLLSGVKLSLSNMKGNVFLSEDNVRAVNTIIGQLDNSINELRRVSHNMMPEALIKYGLKETLENYCENINQAGKLDVRLQTYKLEERMEQDTEIILYRIVQELLNNVVKHADAKQVLVQLMREDNKFTLTVEDDGRGFDLNNPDHPLGAGLQNIKARAGYLNGIVDIRTKPGEGTSVTIEGTAN
jgi:signal transduction histidine kinase